MADKTLTTKAKPAVNTSAAKKAAASTKRTAAHAVSSVTVDGFQVFGTLVRPKHLTPQQIAEAVASID